MKAFVACFVALGVVCGGGLGLDVRISNLAEFYSFVDSVAAGTNYLETTVYLDTDIDFKERAFEPIGNFSGSFDGQGHTISNLKMNSKLIHVGLFGYSKGLSIRNVVMDESCSVVGSSNMSCNVGGIIGNCYGNGGHCGIENVVNMASVTFNGTMKSGDENVHLGGIAGHLSSFGYEPIVKNCINYGSVTQSFGGCNSYIGGIVGYYRGDSTNKKSYIQNSLNYGTIAYDGTTLINLYVGGIIGYSCSNLMIENCVSSGKISNNSTYAGAIIGFVDASTNITHSFWTNDVGYDNASISGKPTIDPETSKVGFNSTFVEKLNIYSANKSWNKWVLKSNNSSVLFKINDYKGFTLRSQVVLLPDPVDNNESTFSGWFNDENMVSSFNSSNIKSDTTLYGVFCGSNYTVTLDVNGGNEFDVRKITIVCKGTYGTLPEPTRTGFTFTGWFTEKEGGNKVEPVNRSIIFKNHTLYAHWQEIVTEYVEIVFGKKDLTREEAEEIINEYAKNAEFSIEEFENKNKETIVIIKFVDAAEAENFVERVRESGNPTKIISKVGFIDGPVPSFSSDICLFLSTLIV